ncbi:hypothetical protein ZWY2020_037561 [Hordeum vulgare]|nr:hypothetical protein ZWY2020_037561 [Hordeum vulgare]
MHAAATRTARARRLRPASHYAVAAHTADGRPRSRTLAGTADSRPRNPARACPPVRPRPAPSLAAPPPHPYLASRPSKTVCCRHGPKKPAAAACIAAVGQLASWTRCRRRPLPPLLLPRRARANDVSDLCIGKPAVRSLPLSAAAGDLAATVRKGPRAVAAACIAVGPARGAVVGRAGLADVLCLLCSSPAAVLDRPVSALLPKDGAARSAA